MTTARRARQREASESPTPSLKFRDKGALDEEECFIDATFAMAKGGGAEIGPTRRGKGLKIMAIVDRHGLPLSVSTQSPGAIKRRSSLGQSQAYRYA